MGYMYTQRKKEEEKRGSGVCYASHRIACTGNCLIVIVNTAVNLIPSSAIVRFCMCFSHFFEFSSYPTLHAVSDK